MRASNRAQLQSKKKIERSLNESMPSIEDLREGARQIYTEVDDLGVRLRPTTMTAMNKRLERALAFIEPESRGELAPLSASVARQIQSATGKGDEVMLSVLTNQRQIINQKLAQASTLVDETDAGILRNMRDVVDDTLDNIQAGNVVHVVDGAHLVIPARERGLDERSAR